MAVGAASAVLAGPLEGPDVVAHPAKVAAAASATVHVHKRMKFEPHPETRPDDRQRLDTA